nr:ATP-binding protein [Actinomyces sp.]
MCGQVRIHVRELIANVLVHRDLSEPTLSKSIDIRLLPDRLIISSPGGLWGLSVDQLGTRDGKSAVNKYLYTIAGYTSDEEGRRVIEGPGTGIRAVRRALAQAGLEPVRVISAGEQVPAHIRSLGRNTAPVWSALAQGPSSASDLVQATGLTRRQVTYALASLTQDGYVEVNGGQGSRYTTYARRP